ncbi:protein disulfide-isomerase, putative [Babesia bigemina]|uniref:protein disulfide-isomerase n=1 Tax=Babesia bigemina TaxID=5866 RepID=A0A061DEV9_BABBI|nr:protein disulfide-isomerase, putative [Babesia bigemina]CDR97960.1 protein disulfide-isomerase, putative [Babesia bigemina]|eukprot:XP_012770146.1 protein disulfide-isomerase, putative [Babesia bigemina]
MGVSPYENTALWLRLVRHPLALKYVENDRDVRLDRYEQLREGPLLAGGHVFEDDLRLLEAADIEPLGVIRLHHYVVESLVFIYVASLSLVSIVLLVRALRRRHRRNVDRNCHANSSIQQMQTSSNGVLQAFGVSFLGCRCMHCQALAPEYEKAAKQLAEEGSEVVLAEINCDGAVGVAQEFGVEGYPTLKFFRKGVARSYTGSRQADGIVSWCKTVLLPAVINVSSVSEIPEDAEVTFVSVGYDSSDELMKEFENLADLHRDDAKFYAVSGGDKAIYVLHKPNERFDFSASTADKLVEFVQQESLPLFSEISHANYMRYFSSGKSISWFCAVAADYEKYRAVFTKVARELRSYVLFAWLDVEKFTAAKEAFAVNSFPSVAHQTDMGRYILVPESYSFDDVDAVLTFYSDVDAGKVARSIKSEEEPANNDGPVVTLVGKTLPDFVNNATRPIMLMIHSPFCEHCKKFMPVYTAFGESMGTDGRVIVALLNGDGNESSLDHIQWTAYPTVLLIQPGSTEVVTFDGKRTLEDLKEFVEKHCPDERHGEL